MTIDSADDLEAMRRVGTIVARTLQEMTQRARVGMTTADLDEVGARVLAQYGARSAPQLVYGFPGVNCISVNDEVVHGVPGSRLLQSGDLIKLDVTAELNGYIADAAVSIVLAPTAAVATGLAAAARSALFHGLLAARAGQPIRMIGSAIAAETHRHGFSVMPQLAGHGIGRTIHEEPVIPQFDDPESRAPLSDGAVIAIEAMITSGRGEVAESGDGWTLLTADSHLAAHVEHTVVVTPRGPLILTLA